MEQLQAQALCFLEKVFVLLTKDDIDIEDYALDHIGYRAETNESYTSTKKIMSELGTLASENIIRNRKIAVFKLHLPIKHGRFLINCIELSSPRADLHFDEGFEHAEFVITESLDDFLKKYPKIRFNLEAITREYNPEVIRQYEGCAVKFHKQVLLDVVSKK